ncbi:MAG: cellulase family glycosylhydrolase [Pirellulales bacterium]|nr:cellulase family glycosylhydrolase [Pirellulales bacterium]
MRTHAKLWVLLGVVLGWWGAAFAGDGVGASDSVFDYFVTRRGDQLFDGPAPLRFISFNIPNLHYIEDNVRFDATNPLRLPDEFEVVDSLESIRQMGGQVARLYTLSVRRADQGGDVPVHVLAPGRFNEEAFRALDMVLAQANRLGVRIIIPLVDQHQWWGGRVEYAAMRGKPKEAFWSDPQVIADFEKTIDYVVHRRNVFTGTRYRDDRAILAWETGNELESPPEWTRRIAAHLKRVDPNHLVIDGRNASRLHQASVDEPNVDVVTTHHYATDVRETLADICASRAMSKGKKPYFIGEFGFLDTPDVQAVLDTVIDAGTAGALIWSLRCHNREGGFYWHSEPAVDGRYKAYHWPGFASGAAYDETGLLGLMRCKAFAIRGRNVPPLPAPNPPELLPIAHQAAISWRGSAGASGYDVQRASTSGGPWTTIARDVSDADAAYRPLFSDATARVGEQYFYRVLAKNATGVSSPSNVVGPVAVDALRLVDELRDGSALEARQGNLAFVSDHARRAKEDMHRLSGGVGGWVVYRTEHPMTTATVYAFFPGDVADFRFAVSSDGRRYEEATGRRRDYFGGQGMYGYFKPVEYRLEALPENARYLKIEFTAKAEIGRVEIASRPGG